MQTSKLYQDVPLQKIAPNPLNPRREFTGEKFDELVASVEVKGVIVPILLRPMPDKRKKQEFEIVFGERRWRAALAIVEKNGGMKRATIPAIVKDMTDEEAFDAMTIENLQREDLTELEEAQSFKTYLDKKGKDGLPELAARLGIHPRYIQRRVAVLELPKTVLKAWETGKIKYGHCEQLIRLKDPKQVKEFLSILEAPDERQGQMAVHQLQLKIDRCAIEMSWAKFDMKAEGCLECRQNSDVQVELFGNELATKETRCLDAACFTKKQGTWLTKNWAKYAKQVGTNGFRFDDTVSYGDYQRFESWTGKPGKKCSDCPDFISIINLRGKIEHKQACIGDRACFNNICRTKTPEKKSLRSGAEDTEKKEGPRVDWHGRYFRERFYHERIDVVLGDLGADHVYILRGTLFSIFKSDQNAKQQFVRDAKMVRDDQAEHIYLKTEDIWDKITQMDAPALKEAIKAAAVRIVLHENLMYSNLKPIGDHIGIDLAREWRINREYLDKKTIGEIHEIGEKHGIFADEKAQAFLFETLGKKRGKFTTCKKEQLIRVILESGVDLAGKVPSEILDLRSGRDRELEAEGERECKTCGGIGEIDDPENDEDLMECPDCKGEGTIAIPEAASA